MSNRPLALTPCAGSSPSRSDFGIRGARPATRADLALPPSVLNIDEKSRSSLFAWRGQFSPQLVEALLEAYCQPDASILDPFMGSGTVLVEGARRGHAVYGIEVNPAAYSIARVYEFCSMDPRARRRALDSAEEVLHGIFGSDLPLLDRHIQPSGISLPAAAAMIDDANLRALLEAVVILADGMKAPSLEDAYRQRWRDIRKTVLALPYVDRPLRARLGDARALELPDQSIDFILTSPPYINVFNYHHNYRSSVESLGWLPLVVARSEIGANRKFRQNRFLTVVQYCIDIALALAEMARVGSPGLRAILVLGRESNVHKTPFYNGEIVAEIATALVGFSLSLRQERVFTNRFGVSIYEDILSLELWERNVDRAALVSRARDLGQQVLVAARKRTPSDRRHYLDEAIAAASDVAPSPMLRAPSTRLGV